MRVWILTLSCFSNLSLYIARNRFLSIQPLIHGPKEVAIVLLACELDLELLIFLLEAFVVVVDLLGYLGHCFQMLRELLLPLLKVILVILFLSGLLQQLLFDFLDLLVQVCEQFTSSVSQLFANSLLCIFDRLFDFIQVISQLSDAIASKLVVHKLCILFLNLALL